MDRTKSPSTCPIVSSRCRCRWPRLPIAPPAPEPPQPGMAQLPPPPPLPRNPLLLGLLFIALVSSAAPAPVAGSTDAADEPKTETEDDANKLWDEVDPEFRNVVVGGGDESLMSTMDRDQRSSAFFDLLKTLKKKNLLTAALTPTKEEMMKKKKKILNQLKRNGPSQRKISMRPTGEVFFHGGNPFMAEIPDLDVKMSGKAASGENDEMPSNSTMTAPVSVDLNSTVQPSSDSPSTTPSHQLEDARLMEDRNMPTTMVTVSTVTMNANTSKIQPDRHMVSSHLKTTPGPQPERDVPRVMTTATQLTLTTVPPEQHHLEDRPRSSVAYYYTEDGPRSTTGRPAQNPDDQPGLPTSPEENRDKPDQPVHSERIVPQWPDHPADWGAGSGNSHRQDSFPPTGSHHVLSSNPVDSPYLQAMNPQHPQPAFTLTGSSSGNPPLVEHVFPPGLRPIEFLQPMGRLHGVSSMMPPEAVAANPFKISRPKDDWDSSNNPLEDLIHPVQHYPPRDFLELQPHGPQHRPDAVPLPLVPFDPNHAWSEPRQSGVPPPQISPDPNRDRQPFQPLESQDRRSEIPLPQVYFDLNHAAQPFQPPWSEPHQSEMAPTRVSHDPNRATQPFQPLMGSGRRSDELLLPLGADRDPPEIPIVLTSGRHSDASYPISPQPRIFAGPYLEVIQGGPRIADADDKYSGITEPGMGLRDLERIAERLLPAHERPSHNDSHPITPAEGDRDREQDDELERARDEAFGKWKEALKRKKMAQQDTFLSNPSAPSPYTKLGEAVPTLSQFEAAIAAARAALPTGSEIKNDTGSGPDFGMGHSHDPYWPGSYPAKHLAWPFQNTSQRDSLSPHRMRRSLPLPLLLEIRG